MRGLDGSVLREKRARRFYGAAASTLLPKLVDQEMQKHTYWSEPEDAMRVKGCMTWYIKKVCR